MKRAFLVLALFVCALPSFAGLTYDFSSVTTGRTGMTLAGSVAVEGKNMRIRFTSGDGLLFQSNTVMISKDGGRSFLVLNPDEKTYHEFSLEDILQTVGNVMKAVGGMVQMSVSNHRGTSKDLGPGETIEGYLTQRSIANASYDLAMKIMGMSTKSHVETTTETWYTTQIPSEYMTFVQQKGLKTGFDELDKLIETQGGTPKGFVLRQIVTTRSTAGKQSDTTVVTTNVKNIREATVAASEFAVPTGYRQEEQPTLRIPSLP